MEGPVVSASMSCFPTVRAAHLRGGFLFVENLIREKKNSWFIVQYLRNMDLIASCSFLSFSQPTLSSLPSHYSLHQI